MKAMRFEAHCAFRRTVDGMAFMPADDAPAGHRLWCELRAFVAASAGDGRAKITKIQIRSYGGGFATDVVYRESLRAQFWRDMEATSAVAAGEYLRRHCSCELDALAEDMAARCADAWQRDAGAAAAVRRRLAV